MKKWLIFILISICIISIAFAQEQMFQDATGTIELPKEDIKEPIIEPIIEPVIEPKLDIDSPKNYGKTLLINDNKTKISRLNPNLISFKNFPIKVIV